MSFLVADIGTCSPIAAKGKPDLEFSPNTSSGINEVSAICTFAQRSEEQHASPSKPIAVHMLQFWPSQERVEERRKNRSKVRIIYMYLFFCSYLKHSVTKLSSGY
jgi:hypothetical protein